MAATSQFRLKIARAARRDIASVLRRSRREFGQEASLRYDGLIRQAIVDIRENPHRPEARPRPEIAPGHFTYHLVSSRDRARSPLGIVRRPRHLFLCRIRGDGVEILRVLHDSRDFDEALGRPQ